MSLSEGHVIASELSDDDNAMASSEPIQPILLSPREGFRNNKIMEITQKPNLIYKSHRCGRLVSGLARKTARMAP